MLLMRSARNKSKAEGEFLKAIEIAGKQHAKLFELRAATSLARLWGENKKRTQGRNLLAPVYDWFTEGFDTADLKQAKFLLDELG
jgi:predicted ATPase